MAAKKITPLPKIEGTGVPAFLLWARRDSPILYRAMVAKLPAVAKFEAAIGQQTDNLGDWTDIFSSIGSTVGDAASSIGSFLATNGNDLLKGALGVAGAVQATKLASTQLQLAQANRPVMQTGVSYNPATGQQQIVPIQPTGYPQSYMPSPIAATWIPGVPNWVPIVAVAGVVAVFFASKMR